MIELNLEGNEMFDDSLMNTSAIVAPAGLVFAFNAVASVEEMRSEQQALDARIDEIFAGEADELTPELLEEAQKAQARIQTLAGLIDIKEASDKFKQNPGPRSGSVGNPSPANPRPTVPAAPKDHKWGFRSLGDMAQAVRAQRMDQGAAQRLLPCVQAAATTYGSEQVGADGGFLVPPEFRREIVERVFSEQSLSEQTDRLTTVSTSLVIPNDETTPWQASGGILCAWEGEGDVGATSNPAFGKTRIDLWKLRTMVKMTDELMSDAGLLDAYLRRKAPSKMNAKLNTAIISGTGVGQPLGILNSNGLVTITKETSQSNDTIRFENVVKMFSQIYETDTSRLMWLANRNTLTQLMSMRFVSTADSPVPVWLPPGGISGSPYPSLFGYPLRFIQACPTLGDAGDLILADMAQYLTVTQGTDIRTDVSIHLHFDQDITTYRFIMRIGGQPWFDNQITQQNASEKLGSFVVIEDR